jgi:hypothetical protein
MVFLLPGLAFAGFEDKREARPAASIERSSSPVSITGFAPIKKSVIGGMGRDMPIISAIEQIVPKDYTLISGDMGNTKVSWQGGLDWTDVLSSVVSSANVSALIDTDKRTITIQRKYDKNGKGNVAKQEPVETWTIKSGSTLREALTSWAEQSGWQMSWEVNDLVAGADVSVSGKFDTAVGMVVEALNRSGAGIRAIFYDANHVLRITEKK